MDFKYKDIAEIEKMTAEQKNEYAENKRNHEQEEAKKNAIAIAEKAVKEATKGLIEKLNASQDIVKTLQEEVTTLKENQGKEMAQKTLDAVLKENKENILKSFSENKKYNFTVSKALTLSTAVTNNSNSYRDDTLSPLASKKLAIYDLFRKVRIGKDNAGTITYVDWDTATTARAAAMVAEGAPFPESTVKWEEYPIKIKKIGDSIPWTEEFEYDLSRFADELASFLNMNVKLKEDEQLRAGDGTGANIFGLETLAPAYVPVASGITDPSRYDLVIKVAEDITKGLGGKFRPDYALMNLTEINKMRLKKDGNNNYVMPPFVDRNGNVVAGIRVIEDNGFADNTMVIGDSRYGTIYEDEQGYTITTGEVNNQFLEDEKTLKARKRMCFLIKESEKIGHRKVTDIATALATLATP